jgi:hypothetical protein
MNEMRLLLDLRKPGPEAVNIVLLKTCITILGIIVS